MVSKLAMETVEIITAVCILLISHLYCCGGCEQMGKLKAGKLYQNVKCLCRM